MNLMTVGLPPTRLVAKAIATSMEVYARAFPRVSLSGTLYHRAAPWSCSTTLVLRMRLCQVAVRVPATGISQRGGHVGGHEGDLRGFQGTGSVSIISKLLIHLSFRF